jgi:hypothetical protein
MIKLVVRKVKQHYLWDRVSNSRRATVLPSTKYLIAAHSLVFVIRRVLMYASF